MDIQILESVIDQLRFEKYNSSLIQTVNSNYTNILYSKYRKLLKELENKQKSSSSIELLNLFGLLDDDDIRRFINYPQVACFIIDEKLSINKLNYLKTLLKGELALNTKKHDNYEYPEIFSPDYGHLIRCDTSEENPEVMELFILNNSIVVDFFSKVGIEGTPDNLSFNEMEKVSIMIEETLSKIERTHITEFIENLQQVIRVKKIKAKGYSLISSSQFIGQMEINSSDFSKMTSEEIIEAIVHGSIHTLLEKINCIYSWEPRFPGWKTKLVQSPWTGNQINLSSSFSPAVFVWYGLFHLFEFCKTKSLYNQKKVDRMLNFISNGFLKLDIDELYSSVKKDAKLIYLLSLYEAMKLKIIT